MKSCKAKLAAEPTPQSKPDRGRPMIQEVIDIAALRRDLRSLPMDFLSPLEQRHAERAREATAIGAAVHFDRRAPQRTVKLYFNRIEADLARLDRALRETPQVACSKGCTACCYSHVLVTAPEVLNLAGYLRATLSSEALGQLTRRVEQTAACIRPLSPEERWSRRIPCPLLTAEGYCAGYRHRPIVCHAHNSTDPHVCATVPPGDEHHARVDVSAIGQGMIHGLGFGVHAVGLDGAALELTLALEIALRPDAEQRWLDGEAVFAPAHVPESP